MPLPRLSTRARVRRLLIRAFAFAQLEKGFVFLISLFPLVCSASVRFDIYGGSDSFERLCFAVYIKRYAALGERCCDGDPNLGAALPISKQNFKKNVCVEGGGGSKQQLRRSDSHFNLIFYVTL